MHFTPSSTLQPFIQKYIALDIDQPIENEVFYPSGFVDIVILLPGGKAITTINGNKKHTPPMELLGHLSLPTRVSASKGTSLLIARLYPFASSLFFPYAATDFTNAATDISLIYPNETTSLYDQICSMPSLQQKINTLEKFLINRLLKQEKKTQRIINTSQWCKQIIEQSEDYSLKALSSQFGVSARYIQKQFYDTVGMTPTLLHTTQRFSKSLEQLLFTASSLTVIAYDCGYYDQAHFIKEFKKFTGTTPFQARKSMLASVEEYRKAVNFDL